MAMTITTVILLTKADFQQKQWRHIFLSYYFRC